MLVDAKDGELVFEKAARRGRGLTGRLAAAHAAFDDAAVEEEPESPFDEEVVTGIINMLMRIDARLEALIRLLAEGYDDEEDDS